MTGGNTEKGLWDSVLLRRKRKTYNNQNVRVTESYCNSKAAS